MKPLTQMNKNKVTIRNVVLALIFQLAVGCTQNQNIDNKLQEPTKKIHSTYLGDCITPPDDYGTRKNGVKLVGQNGKPYCFELAGSVPLGYRHTN